MGDKNWSSNVPQYIVNEINEYNEELKIGKYKCMKLENIKALIGLSVLNNRITREQGDYILSEVLNMGNSSFHKVILN